MFYLEFWDIKKILNEEMWNFKNYFEYILRTRRMECFKAYNSSIHI